MERIFWVPKVENTEAPTVAELENAVELGEGSLMSFEPVVPPSPEPPPWRGQMIKMTKIVQPEYDNPFDDCNDHEWSGYQPGTMITENGVSTIMVAACSRCRTWRLKLPASDTDWL